MYPYEKINLVPYRVIAGYTAAALLGFAICSVLFRKPTGLGFMALCSLIAGVHVWRAFQWNSEPTARRQFLVAAFVMLLIGLVGSLALDWAVAEYHLWRGECPIWLDFEGRCRRH